MLSGWVFLFARRNAAGGGELRLECGRASLYCRRNAALTTRASARLRNHSTLRHSSRNLPLKLSLTPFCQGLQGDDERRVNVVALEPAEDGHRDGLGPVVGPQHERSAAETHKTAQNLVNAPRPQAAGDVYRQRFAGPFVDHGQARQFLAACAGIEDEIVGPDRLGPVADCGRSLVDATCRHRLFFGTFIPAFFQSR